MHNIYAPLPADLKEEIFEELVHAENVRIERILSKGQTSPEEGWYDQSENEWVVVLEGAGTLLFEDGKQVTLRKGDFFNIPAHAKHKVIWTDPEEITIWLAVFYS